MAVLLGLLMTPEARAAPTTSVQIEIEFLLGYVEGSGCEFYRNGTWHDAKAAQAHLREKYEYLAAKGEIETTENFIERVATRSSFSDEPYKVRCHGGALVTSNQWLRNELVRFRTFNKRPASSRIAPRPDFANLRCMLSASELAKSAVFNTSKLEPSHPF